MRVQVRSLLDYLMIDNLNRSYEGMIGILWPAPLWLGDGPRD